VVVSAATGTGKGSLIAALAILSARRDRRVLLLAHRDELVEELVIRCRRAAPEVGVSRVQAEEDDWTGPIIVGSVPSVAQPARLAILAERPCALLIVDEAHHATSPTYRRILDVAGGCGTPGYLHVGFTATPFRAAGGGGTEGIGAVYEAVAYEYPIPAAIEAGDLVPIEGERVTVEYASAFADVRMDGKDFDADALAALCDGPAQNQHIAAWVAERHDRLCPAIAFAANIAHAQHLAYEMVAHGLRAEAVWGIDPDRAEKIAAFRRGDLDVLCNRDVLTEGFDAPATRAVLLTAPTASLVRYAQMIGRVTRLSPGKSVGWVIDFVGDTGRLQIVTWADLSERMARAQAEVRAEEEREEETRSPGREIVGKYAGTRSYRVQLLGGAGRSLGAAWYEYEGMLVASARGRESGRSVTVALTTEGDGWMGWWLERADGGKTTPLRLWTTPVNRDDAARSALDALREVGLKPGRIDADWKANPITDKQSAALRRWGLRRDTSTLSRGEASALLDARVARQLILHPR
jgi:superfamily II DNA or RNA helicase